MWNHLLEYAVLAQYGNDLTKKYSAVPEWRIWSSQVCLFISKMTRSHSLADRSPDQSCFATDFDYAWRSICRCKRYFRHERSQGVSCDMDNMLVMWKARSAILSDPMQRLSSVQIIVTCLNTKHQLILDSMPTQARQPPKTQIPKVICLNSSRWFNNALLAQIASREERLESTTSFKEIWLAPFSYEAK